LKDFRKRLNLLNRSNNGKRTRVEEENSSATKYKNTSQLTTADFKERKRTYSKWICELTFKILSCSQVDDPCLTSCKPLIELDARFAALVFPHVVATSLVEDESMREVVRLGFENLLKESPPRILRLVLDSLLLFRRYSFLNHLFADEDQKKVKKKRKKARRKKEEEDEDSFVFMLKFPPLLVVSAALRCDMFRAALLFLELESNMPVEDNTAYFQQRRDMLFEIYRNLNEPDGATGVAAIDEEDREYDKISSTALTWVAPSLHFGTGSKEALTAVNATLQMNERNDSQLRLVRALRSEGLHAVSSLCMKSSNGSSSITPQLQDLQYEASYRLARWSFCDVETATTTTSNDSNKSTHELVFELLRSITFDDRVVMSKVRNEMQYRMVRRLQANDDKDEETIMSKLRRFVGKQSMESVSNLQILNEIVEFGTQLESLKSSSSFTFRALMSSWYDRTSLLRDCFDVMEPVNAVRESLLRSVASETTQGKLFLARHLHRIARNARRNERMEIACAAMCRLRCVTSDHTIASLAKREDWIRWEFEEAKCLWDRDERRRAMAIGKRLCHVISREKKSSSLRKYLLHLSLSLPLCLSACFLRMHTHTHNNNNNKTQVHTFFSPRERGSQRLVLRLLL